MTVCTYELALLQLPVELPRLAGPYERADVIELLFARKVIPFHRRWMEVAAAIRTGRRSLDLVIQGYELCAVLFGLSSSFLRVTRVVRAVVLAPARLAPRLVSMTRVAVEFRERLFAAAHTTSLHVVRIDTAPDGRPRAGLDSGEGYSDSMSARSSASFSPRSSSRSPRSMRTSRSRTSGARSSGLNGFVT